MKMLFAVLPVALAGCAMQPHPPLRYVQVVDVYHVHDLGPAPLYFQDDVLYRVWRRRQAEAARDMRFHHGCYAQWCPRAVR